MGYKNSIYRWKFIMQRNVDIHNLPHIDAEDLRAERRFGSVRNYDAAGDRTSVTIPAGTTNYTFTALGEIATVTDTNGNVTSYTYRGKAANKEKNIELEANWNLAI
jgi:YD repeat-containing protein